MDIHVTGLVELERNLNQLPEKFAKGALRAASRKSAQLVRREARRRAPVRTGKLRAGILVSTKIKGDGVRGATVQTYIGTRTKPGHRSVWYGRLIEFGWRVGAKIRAQNFARFIQPLKKMGRKRTIVLRNDENLRGGRAIPARPFLAPAFESSKFQVLEEFKKELGSAISKVRVKLLKVN